jgi:hypothetical protein
MPDRSDARRFGCAPPHRLTGIPNDVDRDRLQAMDLEVMDSAEGTKVRPLD